MARENSAVAAWACGEASPSDNTSKAARFMVT